MKIKFKDGFSMIDKHILERRPVKRMIKNSKKGELTDNLCIYLTAVLVLLCSENGRGDEYTVKEIAEKCHKKIDKVLKVLDNKELFKHNDDGTFERLQLCKVTIEEDEKTAHPETNTGRTMVKPEVNRDTPIYAGAKTKNYKPKEKENTSPSVEVEKKEGAEEAISVFVSKLFDDDNWVQTVAVFRDIHLEDPDVRHIVEEEFARACTVNGMRPMQDGFNETEARKYCYRWLNKTHANRADLDEKIRQALHQRDGDAPEDRGYSEDIGYGRIINGVRYGLHGERVPMDAPRCDDKDKKWDKDNKEWR